MFQKQKLFFKEPMKPIKPLKREESKPTEQLRQIDVILNKKYKYNQEK